MFDINSFNVKKFDSILARGLCNGVGKQDGQMCIEAAICATLDLPHGDDPQCVEAAVRSFKIALNDQNWSSAEARAKGLRDLGIAQLGSKGIVSGHKFLLILSHKIINRLIPKLFRLVFTKDNPLHKRCLVAADSCENAAAASAAADASAAAYVTSTAVYVAYAADRAANAAAGAVYTAARAVANAAVTTYATYAAYGAYASGFAATAARATNALNPDEFLILVANCGLETLKELESPGCKLLGI